MGISIAAVFGLYCFGTFGLFDFIVFFVFGFFFGFWLVILSTVCRVFFGFTSRRPPCDTIGLKKVGGGEGNTGRNGNDVFVVDNGNDDVVVRFLGKRCVKRIAREEEER